MDLECLPYGLQERVLASNEFIRGNITMNASDKLLGEKGFAEFVSSADLTDDDVGYTEITESEESNGRIYLTGPLYLKGVKDYKEEVTDLIRYTCDNLNWLMKDPTKKVLFERNQFVLELQPEYAGKVVEYALVESAEPILEKKTKLDPSILRKANTYIGESADDDFFYDDFFYQESDDRSEPSNPRATLDSLADTILKSQSVTPAVANTIATVITTHLLKEWAPGYTKFNIVLSKANTGNTLELKIPTMTRDFIGRFVESRESVEGFLHQNPTITVRMSSGIFRTMKNKSDLYTFFRSLIKYYADGLPRCALRLQSAIGTLHRKQKFQLTQSTLRGLVVLPFKMLTVFDDVDMRKKNFNVTAKEIASVCKYITDIAQNHSSDDKNSILDGLRKVIDAFNECTEFDENLKAIRAAYTYLQEGFMDSDAWEKSNGIWQDQQVDLQETYHHPDPEVAYLQEANRVKKLKKLPRDLVAYITIETESIEDANDKMMIASYCLGKLDIVEWYIELIDTANPRYIVPHPRPYLVTLRTELLECYKNIMATKIPDKKNRPYLDIQYPAGMEG